MKYRSYQNQNISHNTNNNNRSTTSVTSNNYSNMPCSNPSVSASSSTNSLYHHSSSVRMPPPVSSSSNFSSSSSTSSSALAPPHPQHASPPLFKNSHSSSDFSTPNSIYQQQQQSPSSTQQQSSSLHSTQSYQNSNNFLQNSIEPRQQQHHLNHYTQQHHPNGHQYHHHHSQRYQSHHQDPPFIPPGSIPPPLPHIPNGDQNNQFVFQKDHRHSHHQYFDHIESSTSNHHHSHPFPYYQYDSTVLPNPPFPIHHIPDFSFQSTSNASSSFDESHHHLEYPETARIFESKNTKILLITETKGNLDIINEMVSYTNVCAVIHAGDFGFYDNDSVHRLSIRQLRNCIQYSSSISSSDKLSILDMSDYDVRQWAKTYFSPSQLPDYLSGKKKFLVPIYVIFGNQEDVYVLRLLQRKVHSCTNLYLLDATHSHSIILDDGLVLRIFGLGGSIMYHKFFDVGETETFLEKNSHSKDSNQIARLDPSTGIATKDWMLAAGAAGAVWVTLPQIGKLLEEVENTPKCTEEIRIFVSHVIAGKEPLVYMLACITQADLVISGGLHNRYAVVYNEFSIRQDETELLESCRKSLQEIDHIWNTVQETLNEKKVTLLTTQKIYIERALQSLKKVASMDTLSESQLRNIWNVNLPDYHHGYVMISLENGHLSMNTNSFGTHLMSYKRNSSSFYSVPHYPANNWHGLSTYQWPSGPPMSVSLSSSSLPIIPRLMNDAQSTLSSSSLSMTSSSSYMPMPSSLDTLAVLLQGWPAKSSEAAIKEFFKDINFKGIACISMDDDSGCSIWDIQLNLENYEKIIQLDQTLYNNKSIRIRPVRKGSLSLST